MYLMYSKESCPQCTQLESILKSAKAEFEIRKLGEDFTRDDLVNLFGGLGLALPRSFPILFKDCVFVGGLTEARRMAAEGQL